MALPLPCRSDGRETPAGDCDLQAWLLEGLCEATCCTVATDDPEIESEREECLLLLFADSCCEGSNDGVSRKPVCDAMVSALMYGARETEGVLCACIIIITRQVMTACLRQPRGSRVDFAPCCDVASWYPEMRRQSDSRTLVLLGATHGLRA